MKKYTALSLVAMSCLSCNPIVVQPDAGVPTTDAGTKEEVSNHTFQPQNIIIAKAK
jgi:hypothetical protein